MSKKEHEVRIMTGKRQAYDLIEQPNLSANPRLILSLVKVRAVMIRALAGLRVGFAIASPVCPPMYRLAPRANRANPSRQTFPQTDKNKPKENFYASRGYVPRRITWFV